MHEWRAFLSVAVGILLAIAIDELTKYFTDTHHKPGQGDRQVLADRARRRSSCPACRRVWSPPSGRSWSSPRPSSRAVLIYWGQPVVLRPLRRGHDRHRHAHPDGQQRGHGLLRPDRRQRQRHRRDGRRWTKDARQIMADLDAVGNTTKAITKGVAIGSAVIAAVSLFGSFLTDVTKVQAQLGVPEAAQLLHTGIRISVPIVFVGMLIGGAIPWLFSSLAIKAVSRAASLIVVEVRRQFKIPGLMEGKVKPDYRPGRRHLHRRRAEGARRPGPARRPRPRSSSACPAGRGPGRVPGRASSSPGSSWPCSWPTPAAPGTTPRS